MKKVNILKKRLANHEVIILAGAMGTEILRRGVATTLPLWSAEVLLTRPEVVQKIHEDYIKAGAEIITTNTFRTTKRTFAKENIGDKAKATAILACTLAQHAVEITKPKHTVYIAGSIAPLEDCYSPELTPTDKELEQEHYEYAESLKECGVDFLFLETMITLRETVAAIHAAKKVQMSFGVSFCTNEKGELLGGESLEQVVSQVEKYSPLFIGVNCVSPEIATNTIQKLKALTKYPISVYAQGDGTPSDKQGWEFIQEKKCDDYINYVERWVKEGAQIIGGCCGTNPLYIQKINEKISN